MKYFVTQITTVNGATAIATTEKTDHNEAKALYHQILASAYVTEGMEYFLVYVDNEYGNRELLDVYKKPAPAPEPEE